MNDDEWERRGRAFPIRSVTPSRMPSFAVLKAGMLPSTPTKTATFRWSRDRKSEGSIRIPTGLKGGSQFSRLLLSQPLKFVRKKSVPCSGVPSGLDSLMQALQQPTFASSRHFSVCRLDGGRGGRSPVGGKVRGCAKLRGKKVEPMMVELRIGREGG